MQRAQNHTTWESRERKAVRGVVETAGPWASGAKNEVRKHTSSPNTRMKGRAPRMGGTKSKRRAGQFASVKWWGGKTREKK